MGKQKGIKHGKSAIARGVYGFTYDESNRIQRVVDENESKLSARTKKETIKEAKEEVIKVLSDKAFKSKKDNSVLYLKNLRLMIEELLQGKNS